MLLLISVHRVSMCRQEECSTCRWVVWFVCAGWHVLLVSVGHWLFVLHPHIFSTLCSYQVKTGARKKLAVICSHLSMQKQARPPLLYLQPHSVVVSCCQVVAVAVGGLQV